ncbi:MAG: hypothetical protein SGI92_01560 [Bryobacteraceae bacterium]|nr:hypothetical protein [Bryobacteraceae bacterium]
MPRIYEIDVKLTLQGPVLTKGTGPGGFGLDAVAAKNHAGALFLPRTLIKGKLRDAWIDFGQMTGRAIPVEELLGRKTEDEAATGLNLRRGALTVGEFVTATPAGAARRYRIRRDSETRCADNGAYIVSEMPWGAGEDVEFRGRIGVAANDDAEAERIRNLVEKGLLWAGSYGSSRTTGFGRVKSVVASRALAEQPVKAEPVSNAVQLGLRLRFDRPFCFAAKHPSNYLFESEEVVSGGAIKGALAMRWARLMHGSAVNGPVTINRQFDPGRGELGEHFWRLRFLHAFPSGNAGHAARSIPLSTAALRKAPGYFDAALSGNPFLIEGEAPAFSLDWKYEKREEVRAAFGWPSELRRELRVRTAMNKETRKGKDGNLFATEAVVPGDRDWISGVDLSDVPENVRPKVEGQLRDLLRYGLREFGKTKAEATVEAVDAGKAGRFGTRQAEPFHGNLWVVTLQTPALLFDPRALRPNGSRGDLLEVLKKTWLEFCPDLKLLHHYSSQSLLGGFYVYSRFQGSGRPYHPFLLTDAGSVFVFEGEREKVADVLSGWESNGLPHGGWLREYCGGVEAERLWSVCPYVRENGFGEIAVNLTTHADHNCEEAKGYVKIDALED